MQGCPVEPSMFIAEHLISAKSALDKVEYRNTDLDPVLLISDFGTETVLLRIKVSYFNQDYADLIL